VASFDSHVSLGDNLWRFVPRAIIRRDLFFARLQTAEFALTPIESEGLQGDWFLQTSVGWFD
jgi:hypothetical protein